MRTQLVITPPTDLNRPVVEPRLAAEVRQEIIVARVAMAVGCIMLGAAAALPVSGILTGGRLIAALVSTIPVSWLVFTYPSALFIMGLVIALRTPGLFVAVIIFPGLLLSGVILGTMGLDSRRRTVDPAELKPLYVAMKAAEARTRAAEQEWHQARDAAGIGPAAFNDEAVRKEAMAHATAQEAHSKAYNKFYDRLYQVVECHYKIHLRWVTPSSDYPFLSRDDFRAKFIEHLEAEEIVPRAEHVDRELSTIAQLPDALNLIILSFDLPAGYNAQRVPKAPHVPPASMSA